MKHENGTTQRMTAVLPLKDMDSVLLAFSIMDATSAEPVREAIALASYLHRGQTRRSPTIGSGGKAYQPSVPYIQHPLRNTVRLIRWGVEDVDTLVASLLHDTVEDCVMDIVSTFCHEDADGMSEATARVHALEYIAGKFSPVAADTVARVSNPLLPEGTTRKEREASYIEHVRESAFGDIRSALVKVADLSDNVWSLHLTDPRDAKRLVTKYAPLGDVMQEVYLAMEEEFKAFTSPAGMDKIKMRMTTLGPYLKQFQD